MTMIVVDPNELATVSSALRSVATSTAEIGCEVGCCVRCAMPPSIEATVNGVLAGCDQVLEQIAAAIGTAAGGLAQRAGVAANDSLTVASSAAAGGLVGAAVVAASGSGDGYQVDSASWMAGMDTPVLSNASDFGGTGSWMGGMDTPVLSSASDFGGTGSWAGGMDTPVLSNASGFGGTGSWAGGMDTATTSSYGGVNTSAWMNDVTGGGAGTANSSVGRALSNGGLDFSANLLNHTEAASRADLSAARGYDVSLAEFHAAHEVGYDGTLNGYTSPLAALSPLGMPASLI